MHTHAASWAGHLAVASVFEPRGVAGNKRHPSGYQSE